MFDAHAATIGTNGMLLINVGLLTIIGTSLFRAEQKMDAGASWVVLALLAVFAVAGRILLDPLPNVQPVTVIVLLAGIHFGASRSVILATVVALASNLVIGHGLWTLYQALGWSFVGILGATLSSRLYDGDKLSMPALGAVAVASAFLFDWIVSASILHVVTIDVLPYYIFSGIPYDMLHAAGNLAFVAWLAAPLSDIMGRHAVDSNSTMVSDIATN